MTARPVEFDPRRRVLVVTLRHKGYPRARRSWERAFRHWLAVEPEARFDHLEAWGSDPHGFQCDRFMVVAWKYRQIQDDFLAGRWDVLVTIEEDMIAQVDTFPRLLKVLDDGADIAYGLYIYRTPLLKWSAATLVAETEYRSWSDRPGRARTMFGEVVTCQGIGMGCTAIKREVLEDIRLRRGGVQCVDYFLALDAKRHGFVQRCDTGLVCGHIEHGRVPVVLWPDVTKPKLYRRELLCLRG